MLNVHTWKVANDVGTKLAGMVVVQNGVAAIFI